ncbi:GNAT family N-acetyltransferase [Bosea sp. 117]|uniref:GNAT family N-acetyltransferase n=1 Tax=Bosea sp. 117 TaxID=1125973 RepID=UPI000493CE0A|nr:GNAT family N-acetyltransferase [Bosea sp. 117]
MTDICLRPATDADGDGVAALIAGCFAEYEGCLFDRAAEFPELDAIASHFAARGGTIWVADREGSVVGSLAVAPTEEPGTVELFKMYLTREVRGRGLAAGLLGHAVGFARARGAGTVRLWTDTRFTDAHRFYERHGFVRAGEPRPLNDISASWEYPYRRRLAETE